MRYFLVPLAFFLAAQTVNANPQYTLRSDGFYWRNGRAYTRSRVYEPQSYVLRNGYYCPTVRYYTYSYTQVPVIKKTVTKKVSDVPPYAPGWREAIIKAAEKRDDLHAYLIAVDKLGFSFPFKNTYSTGRGNSEYPSLYGDRTSSKLGYYGAQGETTYGYSLNQTKDYYGAFDVNAVYQAFARGVSDQRQLMAEGTRLQGDLVDRAGERAGAVAEIISKGRVLSELARLLQAAPSGKTVTTITGTGTATTTKEDSSNGSKAPVRMGKVAITGDEFVRLPGPSRCVSCHSGPKAEAGFQINSYPALTEEQKEKVLTRIFQDSEDAPRMPLGKDGKSAGRLPRAEVKDFTDN